MASFSCSTCHDSARSSLAAALSRFLLARD
jgi:hypothetical protein